MGKSHSSRLAEHAYRHIANLQQRLHPDTLGQICDPLCDYNLKDSTAVAHAVRAIQDTKQDIENMHTFNNDLLVHNTSPSEARTRLIRNKGILEQAADDLHRLEQILLQVGSNDQSSRQRFMASLRTLMAKQH